MTEALTIKPGDTFAEGFRVVQELGQAGDASALFAAEQVLTGRACMLRVLHPRFVADKDGRARFEDACKVRASIESEHVVELLAAGVDSAHGTPWFALERLEGEPLADWLARGALSADDQAVALDLVGQLGAAFTAVRAAGHAPGCLKPAKVFVATRQHLDGGLTVKLLDFWTDDVVHGADDAEETDETPEEDAATLTWQAPEVDDDDPEGSAASDVWTLGLLAFHLLVGKPYWKALSKLKAKGSAKPSAVSLVREVASETHEPASARARVLGFRRPLPEGFDDWFARCVAHDPDERFADPAEATEALEALFEGEPEDVAEEEEEEDLPPPPPRKGAKGGARSAQARAPTPGLPAWATRTNVVVPVGLALVVALALGVRAVNLRRRPPAAAPVAAAGATGVVVNAPAPTALSASAREAFVNALRSGAGSPAWIAVPADNVQAQHFGDSIAQAFTEAGWHVNPISQMNWSVRPGVFLFAADEQPPGYVDIAARALTAAGLQATVSAGYRAFYQNRVVTQPGYTGVNMAADQTFVLLIGQIQ